MRTVSNILHLSEAAALHDRHSASDTHTSPLGVDPLLTMKDVKRVLQQSDTTIWRHIHAGELSAFKIGRSVRVKQSELRRFIDAMECKVKVTA